MAEEGFDRAQYEADAKSFCERARKVYDAVRKLVPESLLEELRELGNVYDELDERVLSHINAMDDARRKYKLRGRLLELLIPKEGDGKRLDILFELGNLGNLKGD